MKLWEAADYPELAANEFFCLTAARRAGLNVPEFLHAVDLDLGVVPLNWQRPTLEDLRAEEEGNAP